MFSTNISVNKNPTEQMLDKMEKSPFVFHLTGSRYFGIHTSISDYDFFTQSSEEVRKFLVANNFSKIGDMDAYVNGLCDELDSSATWMAPYSKPKPVINPDNAAEVWRGYKIDIQLVANPELKLAIQEVLKKHNIMSQHNLMSQLVHVFGKAGMVEFWNMLYDVAKIKLNGGGAEDIAKASSKVIATHDPEKPITAEDKKQMVNDFEKNFMQ